jgi:hypothetical protein
LSNLRLKSNVYLRRNRDSLREDADFIHQVRGLAAVRKLLSLLGLSPTDIRYESDGVRNLLRQGKITNLQHNALKSLRCLSCDSLPIGLTFQGKLESRCNTLGCKIGAVQVKRLLLPDSVLKENSNDLRAEQTLMHAIEECYGTPPTVDFGREPKSAILVRIDPTTAFMYSEDELSGFLLHGLTKRQS